MSDTKEKQDAITAAGNDNGELEGRLVVNASGHIQELDRQFGLFSICSMGICTDNAWSSQAASIVVALYNGGPPGVIYELLAVSVFYLLICACIAELASAIPSSAGVYHWAFVTGGPRWGRICSWYAGWWNVFAWNFGAAASCNINGEIVMSIYALYHPGFTPQRWQVFIVYLITTWLCCLCVLFGNRVLPFINRVGLVITLGGLFVTILVCAIMPGVKHSGYARNRSVWADWNNQTGWTSNGFVFLAGMLNGAYGIGTPDVVSHLAEEIPNPRVNLPKAIFAQMLIAIGTTFVFLVAIFYSIHSLDDVLNSDYLFPMVEIYYQATSSRGGAVGLLLIIFFALLLATMGSYTTAGRLLWTLARDDATPFSNYFGHVSETWRNPFRTTLACGCICTVLGCIYVGSATAFNALVASFVVLSTLSYLAAILPHILTRRAYVTPGPFWMAGMTGLVIPGISCAYMIVWNIIFFFPYSLPVTATNMNYSVVIAGGLTLLLTGWWFWKSKHGYKGPNLQHDEGVVEDDIAIRGEKG